MKPEEWEAKDREYKRAWAEWWPTLSEEEQARYRELGITGPETETFTTKKAEFDPERVIRTAVALQSDSAAVIPFFEDLWDTDDLPAAIVEALGDLGSPCYLEFAQGRTEIDPDASPLIRIVLEVVQSEPTPGIALAVILKWLGSSRMKRSYRGIARIFGRTFQTVSIVRGRVSEKLGTEIFAGKSEKARITYRSTNKRKERYG